MIAYLDSSVILRVILGQPGRIPEWRRITTGVASSLIEVECLRTIDRLRLRGQLSVDETAIRREAVYRVIERLDVVELTGAVLHRASQQMSAPLGTLDALHLATADLWRETQGKTLVFATHDRALALGARGNGFRVLGV
ncbi:MAG: type II toxin-antitoxin system VapC family toxin [Gemmatimonadota bacterium]|nr:type II toxin-antitoxin system VapC family toxin [Gemmatimonadota bacterium]